MAFRKPSEVVFLLLWAVFSASGNFGLKMGRVAKSRFKARVRELTEGNPMLEAAANPILAS